MLLFLLFFVTCCSMVQGAGDWGHGSGRKKRAEERERSLPPHMRKPFSFPGKSFEELKAEAEASAEVEAHEVDVDTSRYLDESFELKPKPMGQKRKVHKNEGVKMSRNTNSKTSSNRPKGFDKRIEKVLYDSMRHLEVTISKPEFAENVRELAFIILSLSRIADEEDINGMLTPEQMTSHVMRAKDFLSDVKAMVPFLSHSIVGSLPKRDIQKILDIEDKGGFRRLTESGLSNSDILKPLKLLLEAAGFQGSFDSYMDLSSFSHRFSAEDSTFVLTLVEKAIADDEFLQYLRHQFQQHSDIAEALGLNPDLSNNEKEWKLLIGHIKSSIAMYKSSAKDDVDVEGIFQSNNPLLESILAGAESLKDEINRVKSSTGLLSKSTKKKYSMPVI